MWQWIRSRSTGAVPVERAPLSRLARPRLETLEDRLAPATLPTGFHETPLATGLTEPTAMEVAPDARIFVLQQTGSVRVITAGGELLANPALTLNVDSNGERGLLGIAFDPDFSHNQFI